MTVEHHPIKDRASWLAMRAKDLTASDLGAAIGIDRFKSPLQLYAEKTMPVPAQADNNAMRRGRWLEAAVLSAIRDQQGWDNVIPANVYLRDPELRQGASPDALRLHPSGPPTNIQCKVVSRPVYERDWANGPPLNYVLQTLCEGMLLDAADSIIAALVLDTYTAELYLHPVPRHEAAEARVRAIAKTFWDDVAAGKRPSADYARDADALAAMFPTSEPEPVLDLSADNRLPALLDKRKELKLSIAEREQYVTAIDTEIKDKLGTHERGVLPGWKLSWKTQHRAEHVVPATTYRQLRVTPDRPEEQAA